MGRYLRVVYPGVRTQLYAVRLNGTPQVLVQCELLRPAAGCVEPLEGQSGVLAWVSVPREDAATQRQLLTPEARGGSREPAQCARRSTPGHSCRIEGRST